MNAMARIKPETIHPRLRMISGICNSLLALFGLWNKLHIHARPECPPNDAAAAETKINSGPTGLNAPATQERIPEVK